MVFTGGAVVVVCWVLGCFVGCELVLLLSGCLVGVVVLLFSVLLLVGVWVVVAFLSGGKGCKMVV